MRVLLAAACWPSPAPLGAQTFPNRPVTLTVGFAPGGGTDTAARIIAKKLSENIGQSVVVENKAGAGGNIAAQHVATAPPDGYTIHLTSVGPMTVAPHMSKNLPYDPEEATSRRSRWASCSRTSSSCMPACRRRRSPSSWRSPSRSRGKITYASSGVGGAGHLAGELFKERAGIDMIHVPYKGGGPAMTDLLGGRVDMYPGVPSTVAPHVDAGKLRALATTGAQAHRDHAQRADGRRVGLSRLRGDQLVRVRRARQDAEGDPRLLEPRAGEGAEGSAGARPSSPSTGSSPRRARARSSRSYIERETEKWGKVVREAKITAE